MSLLARCPRTIRMCSDNARSRRLTAPSFEWWGRRVGVIAIVQGELGNSLNNRSGLIRRCRFSDPSVGKRQNRDLQY